MWRPAKLFIAASVALFALTLVLSAHPFEQWIRMGKLEEGMIYRLLFCSLLGTLGFTLLSSGVICENLHRLWQVNHRPRTFSLAILDRLYSFLGFIFLWIPVTPLLMWLVGKGVWTRLMHGYVDLHWSRVVLAALIVFGMMQMLITVQIVNLIRFHIGGRTSRFARRRSTHKENAVPGQVVATELENETREEEEVLVPQSH